MRKIKIIFALVISMILTTVSLFGCTEKKINYDFTKILNDNDALLTNPGMGWDFAYYANSLTYYGNTLNKDDYLDNFPCDIVYFRLGWSDIEPEEGVYRWDLIDKVANEWIARGKRIAFRWCCVFPGFQDTPLWVKEKGAKGIEYNLNEVSQILLGNEFYSNAYDTTWLAYYDDPVFLEELEKFLMECAKRYNGKDFVEFIDVGSLGSWGEGNCHGSWMGTLYTKEDGTKGFEMDPAKNPNGNYDLVSTHLRLWRKCFPDTVLFANDDMLRPTDESFYELLNELNMGIDDDSVQTGNTYEMMANTKVTSKIWQTRPVSIEHHPTTMPTNVYYQSLLQSHASYARIHMNPYQMADSDFTKQMSKKLGYRLVFSKVDFTQPTAGKTMNIQFSLKNDGVAPCYLNGYPTVTIADLNGNIIVSGISDFNIKFLQVECDHDNCLMYGGIKKQEATVMTGTLNMQIPSDIVAGEYLILLSVSDSNGKAAYNLPIDNEQNSIGLNKTYKLTQIRIEK
jgi:hypothetical protein